MAVASFDVVYAGLVPDLTFASVDPSRTDLLKILDKAQANRLIEPFFQRGQPPPSGHRFQIWPYHIDVVAAVTEQLELRVPLHLIAFVAYVHEASAHVVCMNVAPNDASPRTKDLAVLLAPNKDSAEQICSSLSTRFQEVYDENRRRLGGGNTIPTDLPSSPASRNMQPRLPPLPSAATTATSIITRSTDSTDGAEYVLQMLNDNLDDDEMRDFAHLLHSLREENSIGMKEFVWKTVELFGARRRNLLYKMLPLLQSEHQEHFRRHLEQLENEKSKHSVMI